MFQLLDYSHKLEKIESSNTQATFKCPCCGGKLKLNLKTKAYKCFTSSCKPMDIRSRLGAPTSFDGEYRSVPKSIFVRPIEERIAAPLFSITDYVPAKKRVCSDRIITYYYYSDTVCVERVDYINEVKKQFFPKYKVGSTWYYGKSPTHAFGLLNTKYLGVERNVVLMGEGEKVADVVTGVTGYVCITPPLSFGWEDGYIARSLRQLNVDAVIFLPDHDEVGRKKAGVVQRECWSIGIPCSVFDYGEIEMSEGDDIVDLYERGIDIKKLIYDKYY